MDFAENLFTKLNEMETARSEDTWRLLEKTERLVSGSTELKAHVVNVNGITKTMAENIVTAKRQTCILREKSHHV